MATLFGQFSYVVQSLASFLRDNNDINLVSDDSCMCANLATQGDWCKRRRTDSVLSQSAQIGNMDNPRMRIPAEERRQRGRRKGGRESGGVPLCRCSGIHTLTTTVWGLANIN